MTEPHIDLAARESTAPPPHRYVPRGAPNVVMVVLDDIGFSQLGCFGSDIETPTMDGLAGEGLRFTNFHTTALCSPTRASLLTGRNHHRMGLGFLPDLPMRFPGYHGRMPPEAATLADVLGEKGWATYAVGKWHLTPRDERTPAGPFDCWPLGKGFERYYGFLGGDANHWAPDLVRDNSFVDPPRRPEDGYHLTEDLTDEAVGMIRALEVAQPDRPFFLYFATGCGHAPHHVAPEWADAYRGRFDGGWDAWRAEALARQKDLGIVPADTELSPRPDWVDAWDDLSRDARRCYSRMMEVFAGFLTHTDVQLGRLVAALEATGRLDDTIFVLLSDNGASAEGGPHGSTNELRFIVDLHEDLEHNLEHLDDLGGWRSYNHYPWGWALAGNTPLRRWKRYTWEGGVRDPLVLRFPSATPDPGALRAQYCHAVDVAPTILDLCGVEMPERVRGIEQMSVDGVSLRPALDDAGAPELRTTQYYEMWGSRAIYHEGWKAVTDHVNQQHRGERELTDGSSDFHADRWLLFDTGKDFSENRDLAEEQPEKLRELLEVWSREAEANGVFPLADDILDRMAHIDQRWIAGNTRWEFRAGDRLHEDAGPLLVGTDWALAADVEPFSPSDHRGVLCEQGDWTNGWGWFVGGEGGAGVLTWVLNWVGERQFRVAAEIPDGATRLGFDFTRTDEAGAGGVGRLFADGEAIGEAEIPTGMPFRFNPNGAFLCIGHGRGFPVCDDYANPFDWTGRLDGLVMEVAHAAIVDGQADLETVIRHQ